MRSAHIASISPQRRKALHAAHKSDFAIARRAAREAHYGNKHAGCGQLRCVVSVQVTHDRPDVVACRGRAERLFGRFPVKTRYAGAPGRRDDVDEQTRAFLVQTIGSQIKFV